MSNENEPEWWEREGRGELDRGRGGSSGEEKDSRMYHMNKGRPPVAPAQVARSEGRM